MAAQMTHGNTEKWVRVGLAQKEKGILEDGFQGPEHGGGMQSLELAFWKVVML